MKKILVTVIVIVMLAALAIFFAGQTREPVVVDTPAHNAFVASPLVISGEALGTWFFEASFPVVLAATDGTEIGRGIAEAQSDWMTDTYVPFTATVSFSVAVETDGYIVFQKDNPSGLPENDGEVLVPVTFMPGGGDTMETVVYFGTDQALPGEECTTVAEVIHVVPATAGVARAALEELLKGPTAEEKVLGYYTSINQGVTVQSIEVRNGVAYVDLSSELEEGVGGSCRVTHIRTQIERTLTRVPSVTGVVLSVDGRTEDILQP